MKNFSRALRLALRYRLTLVTSILCSLSVALLWGGNITAVYPLVEVVLRGDSMPEWVDHRLQYGEAVQAKYRQKVTVFDDLLKLPSPQDRTAVLVRLRDEAHRGHAALMAEPILKRDRARIQETAKYLAELELVAAFRSDREQRRELQVQIQDARQRIDAEQAELDRLRWIQPHLRSVMPSDPFQTLVYVVLAVLLGTLLKNILSISGSILVARIAQSVAFDLRSVFFHHTLQMDLAGAIDRGQSDLMNRFTSDIASVTGGIQILFGRAVREPLKMVVCLAGAAVVCWRLLVLTLIVTPLAAYLIHWLAKSLKRANRRAMEEMSHIYSSIAEILGGIKVVKAFTMEQQEQSRFTETARQYYRKAMKIARYDALISPSNELIGIAMISVAVLVSGYLSLSHETHLFGMRISDRRLTTGACLLFYALLAGMIDPARKLSDVFGRLQRALAASDRVYEVLDSQPKVTDPQQPKPLPRHHRELALENVEFSYTPDQPVLRNVNLRIDFAETIALVGPNGCGKSTLAGLVLRFFDPVSGRVTIDGIDLCEVRQRDLRSQIGLVTQETLLFDDTVANNIRYGSPEATHADVVRAAGQAHADRFIESQLSDGYDTRVGPGGNRLSGGQRQRLALARAILRDPPILILDEATSQIDLESEQLIQQVLEGFIRDRTTLIITHRLASLALADRIVVMDGGRIIDVGTHDQLTARCDFYRRLHEGGWSKGEEKRDVA